MSHRGPVWSPAQNGRAAVRNLRAFISRSVRSCRNSRNIVTNPANPLAMGLSTLPRLLRDRFLLVTSAGHDHSPYFSVGYTVSVQYAPRRTGHPCWRGLRIVPGCGSRFGYMPSRTQFGTRYRYGPVIGKQGRRSPHRNVTCTRQRYVAPRARAVGVIWSASCFSQ
jgi:hypothetical protein